MILSKWWKKWKWNGGRTAGGKAVSNAEVIEDILLLMKGRDVSFERVKAHVGVLFNEYADRLAAVGVCDKIS